MTALAVIIPTAGRRPELLRRCVLSVLAVTPPSSIVLTCPEPRVVRDALDGLGAGVADVRVVQDVEGGLAAAINAAALLVLEGHDALTWVGDDDLLLAEGVLANLARLRATRTGMVFAPGVVLWAASGDARVVDPGRLGMRCLAAGVNMIRQPACVYSARAWSEVGGLDERLSLAFDCDLHLRLHEHAGSSYGTRVAAVELEHEDRLSTASAHRSTDELRSLRRPVARRAWPIARLRSVGAWHSPRGRRRLPASVRTGEAMLTP